MTDPNPIVALDADLPDLASVKAAIERLRNSSRFSTTVQLRRFFDYIVAESLAGRGAKLKAYSIATSALGRPVEFDPARDPIVRVEATRLRAALAAYYAEEGRGETLRVRVPPGSYQPMIEFIAEGSIAGNDAMQAGSSTGRTMRFERRILILAVIGLILAAINTLLMALGVAWLWDMVRSDFAPTALAGQAVVSMLGLL